MPRDLLSLFDTEWAATLDLDSYLSDVLQRSAAWFQATGATLFLQSDNPDRYTLAARAGDESTVPEDAEIMVGEGIAGVAISSGKPMLLGDPSLHPALAKKATSKNKKIAWALIVPLITFDGDRLGVLNLSRRSGSQPFTQDDLQLANSVAGHLALAVSNGRLLGRLRVSMTRTAQLHEQLDTVIQTLPVGVVVLNRDGKILHFNREAETFFATSLQELSGHLALIEAAPPTTKLALSDLVRDALAGFTAKRFVADDEASRAWSLAASPLPGGGASLVIHDATEHERLTREMNRVRRLAEIGQMTAAIAHEIRNPLAAMRGAAQVIQSAPEHALEFAGIIEAEVLKLNELCTDFLDFAKPLELNRRPVDLAQLARDLAAQHEAEFTKAGVKLLVTVQQAQTAVEADPHRLEQVVRNLMLNALQATPPEGAVTIFVSPSSIAVRDTGAGMEQETLEKLFTPFFTTKASGTGLGLSTVRKIVDAHGGTISVTSALGEGTEFRVDLNRCAA